MLELVGSLRTRTTQTTGVPSELLVLSPGPVPQDSCPGSAISNVFLSSDFRCSRPRPPHRAPPIQGGAPWSRTTDRFAGTSRPRGELDRGPDANAEVLCGAMPDNKNHDFRRFLLYEALWRTRTADPLLTIASFPRRALSFPQKPRTCPQYLSPDPRRTAPRPSIAPRRIRRNLARPRRSSRARSSHDCWQHREASAQMRQCSLWPARLRALRLGGRVAATVRSALDTESPPAHHRNCTTGVVS